MADSDFAIETAGSSGSGDNSQYKRRVERISKENAFMVLAMWMERSPLAEATAENKVGAVLVTEENRLYAMDCTRDGVHAMARLLMKYSQKLNNSTIYTSRRPCSFCAKLLVQCGVGHLYYLPTEPEKPDDDDLHRVDNLLKVARLAHGYFVPYVGENVARQTEEKVTKMNVPDTPQQVRNFKGKLMCQFWKEDWMNKAAEKLRWNACDKEMLPQFKKDFEAIMKWISEVTLIGRLTHSFVRYTPANDETFVTQDEMKDEDKDLYRHLLAMAQILVQRTDDPRTGVGAVIWKENEIVATGWNGFPAKALYGEFPRASDKDEAAREEQKKYPYVIHAEQNALLMRNTGDVSGSTLFITKVPCNECVPLLKLEKVKKCVIGINEQRAREEFGRKGEGKNLGYDAFPKEVKKGNFTCFLIKKGPAKSLPFSKTEDTSQSSAAKRRQQEPLTDSKKIKKQ